MNFCLPLLPTNTPKGTLDVEYVEIKMPDCNECEEIMTGAISKFKGVEKCVKDTENQKITVSGSFNQAKLLRKLSSKTGQDVEIVMNEEKNGKSVIVGECHGECQLVSGEKVSLETLLERDEKSEMVSEDGTHLQKKLESDLKGENTTELNSDERKNLENRLMFIDENPNVKCVIS